MSVVGSGQVSGTPDVLRVTFAVEHAEPDVAAAVAKVGERSDAVVAALQAQGVGRSQLATSAVNVYQDYKMPGATGEYRASHTIEVETKDLTGFSALLTAAVDAAGNSLAIHGLQFDIEDKSDLLTQARELAFQDARVKAAHLATLAGFSLGGVTAVSETYHRAAVALASRRASAQGADLSFNITPGEHTVEISIEVNFAWA
ncbi:SIMPL domain-containing protein [Kribbella sp.]|uniref:SIMPL domain-containing protein n=1 Tax=Kribbella sp. TaxID=1871183 RepID=UPI002D440EB3|nr:SIMPL domain-containing protein [Kribbella sp.]HZX06149.1 SIMPL domain-containing protein [Kribbella sp.]